MCSPSTEGKPVRGHGMASGETRNMNSEVWGHPTQLTTDPRQSCNRGALVKTTLARFCQGCSVAPASPGPASTNSFCEMYSRATNLASMAACARARARVGCVRACVHSCMRCVALQGVAWCACVVCVRGMREWGACLGCVRGGVRVGCVRGVRSWGTCVGCGRGVRVGSARGVRAWGACHGGSVGCVAWRGVRARVHTIEIWPKRPRNVVAETSLRSRRR